MLSDEEHIKRLKSQLSSSDRLLRDAVLQRDAGTARIATLEVALRAVNVNPDLAAEGVALREELDRSIQILENTDKTLQATALRLSEAEAKILYLERGERELKASLTQALDEWNKDKTQLQVTEEAMAKVKAQRDRLHNTAAEGVGGLKELKTQVEGLLAEVESLKDDAREGLERSRLQAEEHTRVVRLLKAAQLQNATDRTSLEKIGESYGKEMQLTKALNTKLAEAQVQLRELERVPTEAKLSSEVIHSATKATEAAITELPVATAPAVDVLNPVNTSKPKIVKGMKLRHVNGKKQREVLLVEVVKDASACVSVVGKPNSTRWMQCEVLAQLTVLPA